MCKIILILFISFFSYSSSLFATGSVFGTSTTCSGYSSPQAYCNSNYGTGYTAVKRTSDWGCRNNSTNAIIQGSNNCISSGSCPTNSTGSSGACTCNTGFEPSSDGFSCVTSVVCPPSNTPVGSEGYFDVGTSPLSMPPRSCDAGCGSRYIGEGVQYSRLVNGVKRYYAKGGYISTGTSCSTGSATGSAVPTLSADGCASNQSSITMGGRTKCIDTETGANVNPNSASAVSAASAADAARAASDVAAAQSIATANGQNASGVAAAGSTAAGVIGAGGGSGGSGGGNRGLGNDPVKESFCAENPTSKICTEDEFGEVADSSITNQNKSVAITPISIGSAGVCPAPVAMVIHGSTHYFEWTTYCNFATGIRPIMLVFAWLSAAGILIGGFRD